MAHVKSLEERRVARAADGAIAMFNTWRTGKRFAIGRPSCGVSGKNAKPQPALRKRAKPERAPAVMPRCDMPTDASGSLWALMTVVGPILLLIALIWGTMTYRRRAGTSHHPRPKNLAGWSPTLPAWRSLRTSPNASNGLSRWRRMSDGAKLSDAGRQA